MHNHAKSVSCLLNQLCSAHVLHASNSELAAYIFDQSIMECNGYFEHRFSNTNKIFLCGIWNLHREKLYPLGSSHLVLHSSINRCVFNGRNAMAVHS